MSERPYWLQQVTDAQIGVVGMAAVAGETTKDRALAISTAAIKAVNTLLVAWQNGKTDDDYIFALLFKKPLDLVLYATDLIDQGKEVILRPRTARELMNEFSCRPNPDGSQNFPLGLTVNLNPRPVDFDLAKNDGPMIIVGPENQSLRFLQKLRVSAQQANHHTNLALNWLESAKSCLDFFSSLDTMEIMNKAKHHLIFIPDINEILPIFQNHEIATRNFNWIVKENSPFFHVIGTTDPRSLKTTKDLNPFREIFLDLPTIGPKQFLERTRTNHQGTICWQLKD